MKAIIQRVNSAKLSVSGKTVSQIGEGLLVFLGVKVGDTKEMVSHLAKKIFGLRIFKDENDKINLSVSNIKGEIMVVSNFTIYGDVSRGNRPNFSYAMPPAEANELYELLVHELKNLGANVKTGIFGQHMHIDVQNDGPINIIMEL